jgi:hypothetical protein
VWAEARALESFDRLAIESLRCVAVAEQRARAGLDTQAPIVPAGARGRRQPLKGVKRSLSPAGAAGGLDQLDRHPR